MRYYVVAVTGASAVTDGSERGRWGTSYSVLDSVQAHREVFHRYHASRGGWGMTRADSRRRIQCEREAERLNALDAA